MSKIPRRFLDGLSRLRPASAAAPGGIVSTRGFFGKSTAGGKTESNAQVYGERRRVGHPAGAVFSVVSDVASYRDFVPWCKKSEVLGQDRDSLVAELVIGFPPLVGNCLFK